MKLQPNFSWQKYEGKPEEQWKQFQYQLQNMHIQAANTTNATIDDESYWTRERPLSYTWVDGRQMYSKTLALQSWTAAGTINTIPHGVKNPPSDTFTIVLFTGYVASIATTQFPLPYVDPVNAANSIGMRRVTTNIILTSGGTDRSAFTGYVTIYYVKE